MRTRLMLSTTITALCAVFLALATCRVAIAHETHQTMTVADFDPETRTLQIMLRLESDGLEEYLSEVIEKPVIVEDPETERHVASMVGTAVRLANPDGTLRQPEWVGMENEGPWTYVYVQFPLPRKTDGLKLCNTVYFDHDEEQTNLVNLQIGDEPRTLRFDKDNVWAPIDLPPAPDTAVTPISRSLTIGDGPIEMILIPTHNCDSSIFTSFMERNASRYTMHALTLPGVAGTGAPPKPLPGDDYPWIDNAVDAVALYIEARGLDHPVIMGHGLGGIVAYRLGAERPDVCGPIITLDAMPAPLISKEPIAPGERKRMIEKVTKVQIIRASDEQWAMQHRKLAASIVVEQERRQELIAHFERTSAEVGKQYYIEYLKTDVSWLLPKITVPVLVIGSVNNLGAGMGLFAADVESMWRALFQGAPKNITLDLWKDTGLFITEERPEKLDQAVAAFLDQAE